MNINMIEELSRLIWAHHSFSHRTLTEAKQTVKIGELEYCFDAWSLHEYSSNLSFEQRQELCFYLNDYYNNQTSEERKKQKEYTALFEYLNMGKNPYRDYSVIKEERPDFVLSGKTTVGIEVVEFTTEKNAVLESIARNNFGRGKTPEEIHQAAREKHKSKAERYNYHSIEGKTVIGIKGLEDVKEKLLTYATLIYGKYEKYKEVFSQFNEFIVLCEARNTFIIDKYDTDSIIEMLNELDAICGFSVSILFLGDRGSELATYRL